MKRMTSLKPKRVLPQRHLFLSRCNHSQCHRRHHGRQLSSADKRQNWLLPAIHQCKKRRSIHPMTDNKVNSSDSSSSNITCSGLIHLAQCALGLVATAGRSHIHQHQVDGRPNCLRPVIYQRKKRLSIPPMTDNKVSSIQNSSDCNSSSSIRCSGRIQPAQCALGLVAIAGGSHIHQHQVAGRLVAGDSKRSVQQHHSSMSNSRG